MYLGNKISFLEQWTGTCFIASMYVMPLFYLLVNKHIVLNNKIANLIIQCGKASYNIFLFQMLYYTFFAGIIYKYIPYNVGQLLLCLLISSSIGYIFFKKEDPFTKSIIKKVVK